MKRKFISAFKLRKIKAVPVSASILLLDEFMKKRKVSSRFTVIIFTSLTILTMALPASAENIFMKDGSIVEGKIIADATDYITIKDKSGKERNIERRLILRILYTSLNLSKLYVQKRTGESFVAYLVDEDRDDYLFRRDLYKPVEFKVSRKDVLFMSEKNPSALKGDATSDEIALSWLPPYGQVKVYKIYMKMKKEDQYRVAATTKDKEIRIKGLVPQTAYYFIVRAIDDTDYETNPSNEIKVLTKSLLPGKPVVKALQDDKGNWNLAWNATADSDGKVEKYRVYTEKDGKYALLKETNELKITIPADTDFNSVSVRSVDNNGDESEPVDYRNDWRFQLSPQFWIPVAEMSVFAGNGYGACIDVSKRDIFMNDLELGATCGFMDIEGKKKIGDGNSNVTALFMMPVAAFAAYRIPLNFDRFNCYDVFSVFPKVSTGVMVAYSDYELLDSGGGIKDTKTSTMFVPFVKAGFFAEYGLSRDIFFTLGSEFTYLIDSTQGLCIMSITASAGYRF